MLRMMEVKLLVSEDKVGGIIADLEGRFDGIQVGVIEKVPFHKNKTKGKAGKKKKMPPWSAKRKRAFRAAQKLRKARLEKMKVD